MKKIITLFIKIYQLSLSRFTNRCIYKPSCSEYLILSIKKYGVRNGFVKFKERAGRCTPDFAHMEGTNDYPYQKKKHTN